MAENVSLYCTSPFGSKGTSLLYWIRGGLITDRGRPLFETPPPVGAGPRTFLLGQSRIHIPQIGYAVAACTGSFALATAGASPSVVVSRQYPWPAERVQEPLKFHQFVNCVGNFRVCTGLAEEDAPLWNFDCITAVPAGSDNDLNRGPTVSNGGRELESVH